MGVSVAPAVAAVSVRASLSCAPLPLPLLRRLFVPLPPAAVADAAFDLRSLGPARASRDDMRLGAAVAEGADEELAERVAIARIRTRGGVCVYKAQKRNGGTGKCKRDGRKYDRISEFGGMRARK